MTFYAFERGIPMDNNLQEAASKFEMENSDSLAAAEKQEVTKDNPGEDEKLFHTFEENIRDVNDGTFNTDNEITAENLNQDNTAAKPMEISEKSEDRINNSQVETRKTRRKLSREKIRENLQAYKSVDYSGFIERLFARGADFLIVIGFGYLTYRKVGLTKAIVYSLLFDLTVRILFTYFLGATIGKIIFGTRVISRCSAKLSIWQVIIRELSKYISGIMLNFGYISIIVSKRKRAWHDIMAGTAVTSGGREEAKYAREVYKERPENWYAYIAAPIIVIFAVVLLVSVNKGSDYLINHVGMIGFTKVVDSKGAEFKYKVPPQSLGAAGINKNIIQVGDIDGDKGIELFKEGINEGKTVIKTLRITATKSVDGDVGILCEKPVIQYRLADINGDKKDELVVLYEDRTVKLYKLDGEQPVELSSFGPVQLSEVNTFVKGRVNSVSPYKLFVLGDKNKLSVLGIRDGKMEEQKYELPGSNNIISLDTVMISDKHYVVGATDDGKLVVYKFEAGAYQKEKEHIMPVKEKVTISVRDLDCDGINEVFVMTPAVDDEKKHTLSAYDVWGDTMKLKWNGGIYYKNENDKLQLVFDDSGDIDGDKKLEAYMVNRKVSDSDGRASLVIFESDKYLLKANDLLRALRFYNPQQ